MNRPPHRPRLAAACGSRGYTLVELLVALAVLSAVAGLALVSTASTRRLRALAADHRKLVAAVNEARFGALNGASPWLLTIDCDAGRVEFGADDGWLGTYSSPRPGQTARRDYYPGSPDFDEARRADGTLQGPELRGSFSLAPTVRLVHEPDSGYLCPSSLGFGTDAAASGLNVLWIADRAFDPLLPRGEQPGLVRPLVILPSGAVHVPGEQ